VSRIRSIHPGLFTDEAFVVLSPIARVFFMGLWTECDDTGSFEWSPLKLKMRLLPADNADAAALLAEIEAERGVMKYEVNGRVYGAVRNFCQYQRPKKPNSVHPQTDAVRNWVNTAARSTRDGSEPVPHQLPTEPEIPRQMEDEGGRMETVPPSGETEARPTKSSFPKPEGVQADHWRDFLANRKRKALSNTPTAHKRLMDDLARLSDDEWPPGRLIEHAAAHGWAGIYDPRVKDRSNGSDRKGSSKRTGPVDGFGIALAQAAGRET